MEQVRKGQFLIISALIAAVIMVALSNSISQIQSQTFEPDDTAEHINQLKDEARKITADDTITEKEKRNFRKLMNFVDGYRTEARFDESNPSDLCVVIVLQNSEKRIETPCVS